MFQFNRSEGLLLEFPAGFERQFQSHLELVRQLRQANVYPRVDLTTYVATSPGAALSRVLVLRGSSNAAAPGCTVDVNGLERNLRAIEEEIAACFYERTPVD